MRKKGNMETLFEWRVVRRAVILGSCLVSMLAANEKNDCQVEKEPCLIESSLVKDNCSKDRPHRIEFRHVEGDGIGYKKGYSSTELFFSHQVDNHLAYFDGRGHFLNQGKWAFNGGFGFRSLNDPQTRVFGYNLFYDFRETHHKNYSQIGLGFETLGKVYAFRANGYIPIGKARKLTGLKFDHFSQHYAYLRSDLRQSMWGVEGEIERQCYTFKKMDLDLALGSYYFQGVKSKSAVGMKARASAKFYDCFYLKAMASYDNLFHFNIQGEVGIGFSFSSPFKSKPTQAKKECTSKTCTSQELMKRMTQLPVRQDLIVVSKAHGKKLAKDSSGNPYFFYHVDNTSVESLGTFEHPFNTLSQAQVASVNGETIYVHFGDGTSFGLSSGISLKDDQRLLGSSVDHLFSTPDGMVAITAQTPGLRPALNNATKVPSGPTVILANGSEVSGFYIVGASAPGIQSTSITRGVKISNNFFSDNVDHGVDIILAPGVVIEGTIEITDNIFTGSSYEGVTFTVPATDLSGVNVKINNNEFYSQNFCIVIRSSIPSPQVFTGNFTFTGEINNNLMWGCATDGFADVLLGTGGQVYYNLTFDGNTIASNRGGIGFDRMNGHLTFTNNTFINNTAVGLLVHCAPVAAIPENLTIDLIGNKFFDNGGSRGIEITLGSGTGRSIYCRLIDNNYRAGPETNNVVFLQNNTADVNNFKLELENSIGAMLTIGVTIVQ